MPEVVRGGVQLVYNLAYRLQVVQGDLGFNCFFFLRPPDLAHHDNPAPSPTRPPLPPLDSSI